MRQKQVSKILGLTIRQIDRLLVSYKFKNQVKRGNPDKQIKPTLKPKSIKEKRNTIPNRGSNIK